MASTAAIGVLTHCRVLVVEDEYFLADDFVQVLERLGAEIVGPVPTRDRALALLQSGPVDAAVLDINLKGQMVFPVADALREKGVPFMFATGYGESSMPDAYKDVPRWEKPFKPEDLAQALSEIVQAGKASPR